MKFSIAKYTVTATAAALLALAPVASAQTTPPTGTTAAPQAATQPNLEEAKKHLTEARNTLSALTQLPAAAQLKGEARTQVSQLISNFNELITTTSDWPSAYAKVSANMTALLGPETAEPAAAASATAGAVGTSGTATATLDPAVREKLVEMRKHLTEFERVAGVAAQSPQPATTTPTPTPTPTTSPTPMPTGTTSPAAQPPTAAPPTTGARPMPTPQTAGTTGATPPGATAQAGWMQHLTAIETMLRSQDEGGGLTLDKAKVEMLRTHLAELRKALERK